MQNPPHPGKVLKQLCLEPLHLSVSEAERKGIIRNLRSRVILPEHHQSMIESADALDAVICVLAGADFVRGPVYAQRMLLSLRERDGSGLPRMGTLTANTDRRHDWDSHH